MTSRRRTDIALVAAAAVLATAVPAAAAWHLTARVDGQLAPGLSRVLGEPVAIGDIETGLTGELALLDVRIGDLLAIDRVEVLVDVSRPLAGDFQVTGIRIERPRVRLDVDRQGVSRVRAMKDRLLAHLRAHRRPDSDAPNAEQRAAPRPRPRLSVRDGSLSLYGQEFGSLEISGLTLQPAMSGHWRARADAAVLDIGVERARVRGRLERMAADVSPANGSLMRLLAVTGDLQLTAGARAMQLERVSLLAGRAFTGSSTGIELHGAIVDGRSQDSAVALSLDPGERRLQLTGTDVPLAVLQAFVQPGVALADARFSGTVNARGPTDESASWSADLDGAVADVVLDDHRVAQAPVALSAHARFAASLTTDDHAQLPGSTSAVAGPVRRLHIERMSLTSGDVTINSHGTAEYLTDGRGSWIPDRARLSLELPRTSCARVLTAAPAPFRAQLLGLDLSGTISARMGLGIAGSDIDDIDLDLAIDHRRCKVLRDALAADPRVLGAVVTHEFPDGSRRKVGRGEAGYLAIDTLPDHLVTAFVASEDARFYRHSGFDVAQIERSLAVDLRAGAFARGGSTITQQLVKNVFLSHERTIARKFQEAILAWRVEDVSNKRQILERYLNIIELGPGVFGIDAAARYWFDKSARDLDFRETAFLVALTPAPNTISRRVHTAGGVDDRTRRRIDNVLRIMRSHRVLRESQYRRALAQRLSLVPAERTAAIARDRPNRLAQLQSSP